MLGGHLWAQVKSLEDGDRIVEPVLVGQRSGSHDDPFVVHGRLDRLAVYLLTELQSLVGLAHRSIGVGDDGVLLGRARYAPERRELLGRLVPLPGPVVRQSEKLAGGRRSKG